MFLCYFLQQWIDLARYTGLQTRKNEVVHSGTPDPPNNAASECSIVEDTKIDETNKQ